ncbi:uncharacterized protein LOC103831468 [Brassica rapa]|uniref:uncharacterized protein LOC103831468 n=1 Tax=Brassica campestris TaxID=3711 RepID=UPI00142E701B|nr:uncharacterized protein LOC103831468 [Brassica rapa]
MAVKTDMSKAYDRLEWEFIRLVLERLGFHSRWINWIMECVSTVTYSFLINGSPRGRVKPSRGIRQGDPLSPYIFILCSEVLSGLCNRAHETGLLAGIQVARGSPHVNHLLFADDTMFFTRANKASAAALKEILRQYEVASGQCINPSKSTVTFSRKAPGTLKACIKDCLNISKEGGIGKYLGLPEHFGRRKRDMFTSIVDRIKIKASGWSNKFLSTAGKMIMLKSVLSPIPSHAMSCFKLPRSLCKRIQSAVTRFWWDDRSGNRKIAWVSWDKMTNTKGDGGLGFRDFESFNDAFLAKLSWRLIHNPSGLLSRVLMGKYGGDGTFLEAGHRSVESHGWKGILIGRDLILQNAGWAVGDGESISVWADPWLSLSAPRRPMGPTPERFANLKVKDLMLPNGSDWNRDLIQQIMPQEEATILSIKASRSGTPDKLIWLGTTSGEYTMKSGYLKALESSPTSPPPNRAIDWNKGVWQLEVAPKIKLFLWKIFQGALAIGDRLVTRNISTGTGCKTCNNVESINHLFLHCDIAYKVWKLAPFSSCIDSRRLLDLNTAWQGLSKLVCLPPTGISTGPLAPWILWSLWLARNNRLFNNKISTPEEIVSRATAAAQEWLKEQRTEPPNTKDTRVLGPPRETDSSRLQTDAAWRADLQCAGLGWTIIEKDQSTTHLSYCYFVSSPLVAEALAVRDALAHCRALGILRLRCQTDSQQLVKALATKDPNPEIYGIVSDTLILASSFDSISFEWLPRAQNNVADALAKQALYNACPVTPQIDSEV